MKKFRKILQSACSILMAFVLVFAIGCSGSGNAGGDGGIVIKPAPEKPAPTFELSKKQIECIVGDVSMLNPKSLPDIGQATLTWRSEDSTIATVDANGNIEAISEGTTKIIATYGSVSAECVVKVFWDEELPQIVSPVNDGKFSIVVGQDYTFAPTIMYRGKIYNDGQITIDVSDTAVTAFDAATSTITGAMKGSSQVTISGTWRGKEVLGSAFNVVVSDNVTLSIAGCLTDEIDIYTDAKTFDNNSDQPTAISFVPTAKVQATVDGEPTVVDMNSNPNDFTVEIADANVAFDVNSKNLSASAFGQTIATVKFSYNGQNFVKQVFINAIRPVANFNQTVNYFSSVQGTLRDENDGFAVKTLKEFVYGNQEEVIKTAFVDDQALKVEESGAVLGVTGPNNSTYNTVVRVGTDVEEYNVTMRVYGQYVYEVTDLDVFVRTIESPELDVYVELAKDLDLSDYVKAAHFTDSNDSTSHMLPNHTWQTNKFLAKGFMGTFNGNGHYLMNFTQTTAYGFFAGLSGAVIKNVAFVNCALDHASAFFASFSNEVVMENVYISLTRMKASSGYFSTAVISNHNAIGGKFTNVYIDLEQANITNTYAENNKGRWYNSLYSSFLQFPAIDVVNQPVFENCLVISKAPLSGTTYQKSSESYRVVFAENVSDEVRAEHRKQLWAGLGNAGSYQEQQTNISTYNSRYKNDKLGVYPPVSDFAQDESLYLEHMNNVYLAQYGNDVSRTSVVGRTIGVQSYTSVAEMKNDAAVKDVLKTFSSDFWMVVDGELVWGKHPAGIKDGDVFLDVGELKGKPVEGISLNPLKNYKAGDTVEVGALSCFGYIFNGWKNNTTGEMLALNDGKYTFTYDGSATILVAQWKIDPNVQVNTGNK